MKYGSLSSLLIASFAMTFGANNALAWQENSDTQQKLLACQKLEKMEEQLACFNRIASDMTTTKSQPKPKTAKPASPEKKPSQAPKQAPKSAPKSAPATSQSESNFGLSGDAIARRTGKANEPETIRSTVVKWRRLFNRDLEVTLANGQVWQETSGSNTRLPRNKQLDVTITESWSGGFRMKFEGIKRPAKVKRVK